ncbi:hypothetical protein [Variovorax sp. YR216]|uniref:hypothetical protein n=1 Tax=Variovorax sp. YR216 TaxID=1882828 RepID=UPI00089C0744|nr:hypothetical protein [Variovorax sp. YR216]SEB14102.1 hypothetical protein SAMN05444680_109104 [Variovorax sp. YR216]
MSDSDILLPPSASLDAVPSSTPATSSTSPPWPSTCTLAELGRILTMMHGPQAPSESSLKKWNATGVFEGCTSDGTEGMVEVDPSFTRESLRRPRRAGRPGLRLHTDLAIQRVQDQWPHLMHTDTQAIVELAVARTADRLQSAVERLRPSDAIAEVPSAPTYRPDATLEKIEVQLAALHEEMVAVKRELAQFSALRNNLITKLDEAVARAQDALSGRTPGAGPDPLVEARRDRDMGVLKSMMGDMLEALERIENRSGAGS